MILVWYCKTENKNSFIIITVPVAVRSVKMSNKTTVLNTMIGLPYSWLIERGASSKELLDDTGILPEELNIRDGRISSQRYFQFFINAKQLFPDMSDWVGSYLVSLNHICAPLVSCCLTAPSLYHALSYYISYRALLEQSDKIKINIDNDRHRVEIDYIQEGPKEIGMRPAVINLLCLCEIIRAFDTNKVTKFKLSLMAPPTQKKTTLDYWLGERSFFNAEKNCVVFSSPNLNSPSHLYNPYLQEMMHDQLNELLTKFKNAGIGTVTANVTEITRRHLLSLASFENPDRAILKICDELNMSRTTLWRNLTTEGQSYQSILIQVKKELARELMMKENMTLQQISDQLAFSSQSSFSRFFRSITI